MRMLRFLLEKEFLQIFRNRMMLPILFVMPIIQLLILANAATFELREIPVYLVDRDHSSLSRQITQSFTGSDFFSVRGYSTHVDDGLEALHLGKAKMVIVMPAGMEADIVRDNAASVQLLLDAVDGFSAGIASQYAIQLLAGIQQDILTEQRLISAPPGAAPASAVHIEWTHWYNPEMNYIYFMVPGILVVLVTMIGGFLSGMNIVREREIGTMEQLNVTPIPKWVFIAGKLIPFWVIALVELAFGLVVAWFVFDLVSEGSLLLVFGSAAIYLIVVLGIGLFVSTISETQQQAMFVTWFIMVLFILMSGLFTPIDSMPLWAQKTTLINPMAWFIDIMRRVMLTGAGFSDIYPALLALAAFGAALLVLSVGRYRKTVAG